MSKMIKRTVLCGATSICIFTAASGTVKQPASAEISGLEAELSSFPDTGILEKGVLEKKERHFDLFCSGKYSNEASPDLIIEGFDVIPNPVKPNKDGKLVVANPQSMGTIRLPEGHSGWVRIVLKNVSNTSNNYLCLGITRRGQKEGNWQLFGTGESSEKYIGMTDKDVLEFFPLISSTELINGYTAVKEGQLVPGSADMLDFSSTYRVQAAYQHTYP